MKEEIENKIEKKEHKENKEENEKITNEEKQEVKITNEEIEAINKQMKDAQEEALRAKADLINYRKRKDEEVEKLLKFANEGIVLEILPTLDNFERALKVESTDQKLLDGMKMVYTSLINALNKYGVKEIESLGKKFDANLHHAVITECDEKADEDAILEVLQKGYTLKDKVIRPAMVKVNKK